MNKREVLANTTFGERVAEDESTELAAYFVETDQWHRIFRGEVDVIYGTKGAGKSAIYSLLIDRRDALFLDRQIIVTPGENPRGAPAFKDLVADPPTSEREFVGLWKLYLLTLVAHQLREWGISPERSHDVIEPLLQAGMLEEDGLRLSAVIRTALDYIRALIRIESFEGGLKINETTGMPEGLTGKITLREPSARERAAGIVSVDSLFAIANSALESDGASVWVLLDRLDVAFTESHDLERNALRALFRVYRDLLTHARISPKIFLRSDIWARITKEGFREASHFTRAVTISWEARSLLNLIVRRALRNQAVCEFYGVADLNAILNDVQMQEEFFYKIFPKQVAGGLKQRQTFEWMLSRTWDGSQKSAPRELIHLLKSARDTQLRRLEVGFDEPQNHLLFEGVALREALPEVSKTRLEQTLYAEYPEIADRVRALEGEKTTQTIATLAGLWEVPEADAASIASRLVEIGFFEQRGSREEPQFWVPFLYRDALRLVQGAAEE
jgi:hypothetical protein